MNKRNKCSPLIMESAETELWLDCDCAVVVADDLAENCFFKHFLMPPATCSSRTHILTMLSSTKTESVVWLFFRIRISPKILNSHSHEAELGETDRMHFAKTINGEVAVEWLGTVNYVNTQMGSSCCFYILNLKVCK